jgi:hypothetical protein
MRLKTNDQEINGVYRHGKYLCPILFTNSNSPRDVALMMHTHMLSPVKFQQDISGNPRYSKLAGEIEFPLLRLLTKIQHIDRDDVEHFGEKRWAERYPQAGYHLVKPLNKLGDKTFPPKMVLVAATSHNKRYPVVQPISSIDLAQAVKRQISFAQKITATYPYDPVPNPLLLSSQERYAKFMNLLRLNTVAMLVPTMDIDLFWHTHQLSTTTYLSWCTRYVGRHINHDDTLPEVELSTGTDDTVAVWALNYSEDYIIPPPSQINIPNPPATIQHNIPPNSLEDIPLVYRLPTGNPAPGTFLGPTTADKTPPPGLTPAQLKLWNFDVECQNRHEDDCRRVFQYTQSGLASLEQKILALNTRPPPAPMKLNTSSKTSLFGSVLRAAAKQTMDGSGSTERQLGDLNRQRNDLLRMKTVQFAERAGVSTNREAWGRQRWPLLCAARGWGDPRVTHGKWSRPAQGSTELSFPVYAATWYDDRGMQYYNYLTGHGIEGGGMRIAAGLCGAVFNGGNCKAEYVSTSSCGGGGG